MEERDREEGEAGDLEDDDGEEDEEAVDDKKAAAIRVGRCSGLPTAPDTSFRTTSVPH